MKKAILLVSILAMIVTIAPFPSQAQNSVVDLILKSYSARAFSSGEVSEEALEQIIEAGIKAPSARNLQPWKFTVVRDVELVGKIMRGIPKGNLIIIVSGEDGEREGINVDFDCALAVENMYLAAQSLGLGARIYTSPVGNVERIRQELDIPEGYRVIALLRIGRVDEKVDAVSSASPRKPKEKVVNYK